MEMCSCFKASRLCYSGYTVFSTIIYVRKSILLKTREYFHKKKKKDHISYNCDKTALRQVPLELFASIKALSSDGGYSSR